MSNCWAVFLFGNLCNSRKARASARIDMARGESLPKKGPGRPAGKPNKLTVDLKDMIEGALSDIGGRKWLATEAKNNPAAFMTLIGKLLPKNIQGSLEVKLSLEDLIKQSMNERGG